MPAPWVPATVTPSAALEDEVDVLEDDVAVEDVVDVPLSWIALAWNASKLFGPASTALTEKTMPCPQ